MEARAERRAEIAEDRLRGRLLDPEASKRGHKKVKGRAQLYYPACTIIQAFFTGKFLSKAILLQRVCILLSLRFSHPPLCQKCRGFTISFIAVLF